MRAFCLTSGNLRAVEMAQLYIAVLDKLTTACAAPGPFLTSCLAAGSVALILVRTRRPFTARKSCLAGTGPSCR